MLFLLFCGNFSQKNEWEPQAQTLTQQCHAGHAGRLNFEIPAFIEVW